MIFVKQEYVPRGTCWLAEFNTCNLTYPQREKKMIIPIGNNGMKKKNENEKKSLERQGLYTLNRPRGVAIIAHARMCSATSPG